MPTDVLTYALGQDNLRLRTLLEAVAQDLEGLAARDEYTPNTQALLARAMRIRALLHPGPGDD